MNVADVDSGSTSFLYGFFGCFLIASEVDVDVFANDMVFCSDLRLEWHRKRKSH